MEGRVHHLNQAVPRREARYVLYWAQMNRRVDSNHGLAHAADLANSLDLPVLYYEGLTCAYPYANDRLHTFILEGVDETSRRLRGLGIGYEFHARKRRTDPNRRVYELARDAAAVVTDDYPAFIAAQHNASVPGKLDIPFIAVDSSCVVPTAVYGKQEWAAYTIRPKIHRMLPKYLVPVDLPKVRRRLETPPVTLDVPALVAECEIDHTVKPSTAFRGGRIEAEKRLSRFLEKNLRRYARERNEPSAHATSNLSPYLHFGQISSLEMALAAKRYAEEHKLIAEEFLEELIVRRELAFNFARYSKVVDSLDALPLWARQNARAHASDIRDPVYTREQLERAETYDELWNATQKELLLRGVIHGYYRMYWGKKIIEWSATFEEALAAMIYFHDRYALDGRDPNTYTNILWCFGLHDRPWPERPVFGKFRYMSLEGMKRKTDVAAYLKEIRYVEQTGHDPLRLDA